MEKTNAFTDKKTSELFKFTALFIFTIMVVVPPAILIAGIAYNGLINKLNFLPLISVLCSICFFKNLAIKGEGKIVRTTLVLVGIILLFIISVVSYIWFIVH